MLTRWIIAASLTAIAVVAPLGPAAGIEPFDPGVPKTRDVTLPGDVFDDYQEFLELVDELRWAVPSEVTESALSLLFVEIALLEELQAFDRPTPETDLIHFSHGPFPDGSRSRYVEVLDLVDDDLAAVKLTLLGFTETPIDPIVGALDELEGDQRSAILRGATGVVSVDEYVGALSMLMSEGTADELVRRGILGVEMLDLPDTVAALADPDHLHDLLESDDPAAMYTPRELGPFPDDDPAGAERAIRTEESTGPPSVRVMVLAGAGAAVVVTAALLVVLLRRRGRAKGSRLPDLADNLRRLTNASDEAEVADIAIREACGPTGAVGGVLLRPAPGGVRPAGHAKPIVGTRLQYAIDTGQAVITSLHDDPLAPGRSLAVAAVPLIAEGRVTGVLAVWRSSDAPFAGSVRVELEQLAPNVAAALSNIDRVTSSHRMALVDYLTSLGNRRRLDHDLRASLDQAVIRGMPVSFAMIDVDHFKIYNDTYGHNAGDEALRIVAQVISANVRDGDVVYRYGGEEFSILLPFATSDEAAAVAERVRRAVEAAPIPGQESQPGGTLTVSVGVATLANSTPEAIKERADAALYGAKESGRNRVRTA